MLIALNMTMCQNPQFSLSRTAVPARVLEPLVGSPDRQIRLKNPTARKELKHCVAFKKNYVNIN